MTREVSIGGVRESTHLVEELELPILDDIDALAWITDAIDRAHAERKGIAVVGRKGAGKTIAANQGIEQFNESEREIEERDDSYERRRAVLIQSPRSEKREDVLDAIWKAATGMGMRQYSRGKKKSYEELRDELVEKLLNMRIAVLVLDEAENLSATGFEVLRDVNSVAETRSEGRISGTSYRPAGVGIVLIGTHELKPRLTNSREAGHRWVSIRTIQDLAPAEAARVYRHFLPAFEQKATEVGEDAWNEYIRQQIVHGREVPVRQVENHVRSYVRRAVAAADEEIETKDEIPWDRDLFEWTHEDLVKPGAEQSS